MKNLTKAVVAATLMIGWIWFDACQDAGKPKGDVLVALPPTTNGLPADVSVSCTVSPADFDKWFVSGKATENGVVSPANSVTFPHENNCSFYLWSQQMFLWLTSPLPGQGITVMESPLFYSVSPANNGKRILIPHSAGAKLRVSSTLVQSGPHRRTLMLDATGKIIDSEEGQATGDALMAQNGSLVYYITMVNDVYAFYLNGAKDGKLNANQFPTTAGARDSICAYARTKGVTLPDSNALAMELKTSWVEASTLSNAANYVTIEAVIPVYKKTATQWIPVPNRDTTVKLALVGMHVVGSLAGHPEMSWATFEHNKNTPNVAYPYLTSSNTVKTVPADAGTGWLFSNNPAYANPNVSHMKVNGDTINAVSGQTISASNTLRTKPWGFITGMVPNQQDTSVSAANSEIIAINNAVNMLLIGNDLRRNYNYLGATWTFGGNAPDGTTYSGPNSSKGASIGASRLANSTMETYFQSGNLLNTSCFSCHSGYPTPSLNPNDLSHVFKDIVTPIPMPGAMKK